MKFTFIFYTLLSFSLLRNSFASVGRCRGSIYQCPSDGTQTLLFEVGDVNGDGKVDYIRRPRTAPAICDTQDTVLMLGSSTGDFTPFYLSCTLAFKGKDTILTFGDFDGDGKQDILRREKHPVSGQATAEILFYQGSSSLERIALPDNFDLRADLTIVYVGDFNGDGRDDILRQETTGWDYNRINTVYILLSTGHGTFTKSVLSESDDRSYLPGTYTNLFIGDFNGDGKDDIFRQEKGTFDDDDENTGVLLISNGDGTFTIQDLPESLSVKGDSTKLYIGDFNGDCKTDILRQGLCNSPPTTAYAWTDWKSATAATSGVPGTASGTLTLNDIPVDVEFTGSTIANSILDGSLATYTNYPNTYKDGPTGIYRDLIKLAGVNAQEFNNGPITQTLTFSKPVTNPRLAIYSVGQPGLPVTFDFGQNPVTLISSGPTEYGFLSITISGSQVACREGSGILEITGTFTTLTWTIDTYESYHGFTVGALYQKDVCDPASALLLADGNGGFTTVDLPDSYHTEGKYTNLYVGDFNCDGKSDFLKQENGNRVGSDVTKVDTYVSSGDNNNPFTIANLFANSKSKSTTPSEIYLGDWNGAGPTSYFQYWGENCIEFFYAYKQGKCSPLKCSTTTPNL